MSSQDRGYEITYVLKGMLEQQIYLLIYKLRIQM